MSDYRHRYRGLAIFLHRDSIGRRHRHARWRWMRLICNDIECPAVVLVRCDAIENLATAALRGA